MTLTIHALNQDQRYGGSDREPIAMLRAIDGRVRYRPADSIVWYEASPRQKFYDGDTVATHFKSNATIALSSSHDVVLGESTMIGLSLEKGRGLSLNRTVELVKGELTAKTKPKMITQPFANSLLAKIAPARTGEEAKSLVLKDAQGSFELEEDKPAELTVFKALGSTELKIALLEGEIKFKPSPTAASVAPTERIVTADSIKLTPLPTRKLERTSPIMALFEPKSVTGPTPNEAMTASLVSVTPVRIVPEQTTATLAPPSSAKKPSAKPAVKLPLPEPNRWESPELKRWKKPAFDPEVKSGPNVAPPSSPPSPVLAPAHSPQLSESLSTMAFALAPLSPKTLNDTWKVTIDPPATVPDPSWTPFVEIRGNGVTTRVWGRTKPIRQTFMLEIPRLLARHGADQKKLDLEVVPGAALGRKNAQDLVMGEPKKLSLYSLASLEPTPISIEFTGLRYAPPKADGIVFPGSVAKGRKVRLRLENAALLPKLAGFMTGSKAFKLAGAGPKITSGIHFVVGPIVGASLSGQVSRPLLRELGAKLGSELIYEGRIDDYQPLPTAGLNRLDFVEAYLNRKGEIQILSRGRLVKIDSDLLASSDRELLKVLIINANVALGPDAKIHFP